MREISVVVGFQRNGVLGKVRAQRISSLRLVHRSADEHIDRQRASSQSHRLKSMLLLRYFWSAVLLCLFGCGTTRRYGLRVFQPPGNFSFAASSDNDGTMITSSPSFQFTGVATL